MSTRYISQNEINSISEVLDDKRGIELLQKIRDGVEKSLKTIPVRERKPEKEEETKKPLTEEDQEKESEKTAFLGQAKEDNDLGVKSNEDGQGDRSLLDALEKRGLIMKSVFIKKTGETKNSYKLTNEGYSLVHLVEKIQGNENKSDSGTVTPTTTAKTSTEKVEEPAHKFQQSTKQQRR